MAIGIVSLIKLCRQIGAKRVAEIGIADGRGTRRILAALPEVHVTMVDRFAAYPKEYEQPDDCLIHATQEWHDENRRRAESLSLDRPDRCLLIVDDSSAAADCVPDGSLDVVFLDAAHDHKGVAADIAAWLPKVRDGGILCGHDYHRFTGVRSAVAALPEVQLHRGDVWSLVVDRIAAVRRGFEATHGVLYMLLRAHPSHSVQMIVSIASLKKHFAGPIGIVADDASVSVAHAIASDAWLGRNVQVIQDERFTSQTQNECLLRKTIVPSLSPFQRTVLLDCDTLIVDRMHRMFPQRDSQITLTQYSQWTTHNNKRTRTRVKIWSEVAPQMAARMLAKDYPAINTGVIGWGSATQSFAKEWYRLAEAKGSAADDEMSAQLIYPDFDCRILPWYYNASVAFDHRRPDIWGVKIWHGHGSRFLRRIGGQAVWLPSFFEAMESNYAGIRSLPLLESYRFLPFAKRKQLSRLLGRSL